MLGNNRGIALVVTLLVVALLTITVIEFTYSVQIDQRMARHALYGLQASLLARSILETLACPGQAFFESGYWVQGNHRPDEVIEEQRRLLHRLERQRISSHPRGEPGPIRTVHVAWGLIKLGGAYLLRTGNLDAHPPRFTITDPGWRAAAWPGARPLGVDP